MIEFACLNCGARVSTDDDDAGDQIECPGCTIMLRVPTPIGGRLTEKRLATTSNPVAAFTLSCQECSATFRAKAELAGRRVKCPSCGTAVRVTDPNAPKKTTGKRPSGSLENQKKDGGLVPWYESSTTGSVGESNVGEHRQSKTKGAHAFEPAWKHVKSGLELMYYGGMAVMGVDMLQVACLIGVLAAFLPPPLVGLVVVPVFGTVLFRLKHEYPQYFLFALPCAVIAGLLLLLTWTSPQAAGGVLLFGAGLSLLVIAVAVCLAFFGIVQCLLIPDMSMKALVAAILLLIGGAATALGLLAMSLITSGNDANRGELLIGQVTLLIAVLLLGAASFLFLTLLISIARRFHDQPTQDYNTGLLILHTLLVGAAITIVILARTGTLTPTWTLATGGGLCLLSLIRDIRVIEAIAATNAVISSAKS